MTKNKKLIVLSSVPPPPPPKQSQQQLEESSMVSSDVMATEYVLDQMDDFNHPRQRRDIILKALQKQSNIEVLFDIPSATIMSSTSTLPTSTSNDCDTENVSTIFHNVYSKVHSPLLLNFLENAWKKWVELGADGRDPISCSIPNANSSTTTSTTIEPCIDVEENHIPYLIPACTPLLHCSSTAMKQRASQHVIGQMSYYCTDTCTPIFRTLLQEVYNDAILVQTCLNRIATKKKVIESDTYNNSATTGTESSHTVYYILPNHPGHHAAYECFGGYCYVNHIAALAQNLSSSSSSLVSLFGNSSSERVVILDIDYHCGNGTAAIFQQQLQQQQHDDDDRSSDDTVMVISIHCDPNYDYPFHMGFADDSTDNIVHIPLPPGTGWDTGYRAALLQAIEHINRFQPSTVLISLGIDTYENDPCTIRRAGFTLHGSDFNEIGTLLASNLCSSNSTIQQTIFVQEGGYRMDVIGDAAKNVVVSYTEHFV